MSDPRELGKIARAGDPSFVNAVEEGGRATQGIWTMDDSEPEVQRTSRRGVAAVLVGNIGSFATLLPPLVGLPIFIEKYDPVGKAASLGLATGLLAVVLLVLTPIFGALSDRTTSRLGRRKPGLIVGTAIVVAGLVILGVAPGVAVIILGVVVTAAGAAIFSASYSALIPDQVAPAVRGRVLGFQSLILVVMGVTGTIVGPMLIDNQFLMFTFGAGIMTVSTLTMLVLLQDRVLDKRDIPKRPAVRALLDGFAYNPRSAPDFSWAWAGRFLVTLGISFGGFSIYFLTDQLQVTEAELPALISIVGLINLGGTVIGTLSGAFISDKLGKRKSLVLITAFILAAGGIVTAFAPDVPVFLIANAVIAFGLGTFIPVDGALVMDVLPGDGSQTAKYMSIMTIADQLPRAIGPFLAPTVIALGASTALGGYPLLYLFMGVFAVLGGIVVRRIKGSH